MSTSDSSSSSSTILYQGEVWKWANYVKGWQKRKLVLRPTSLEYFSKGKLRGVIDLASVILILDKKNKHRFVLDSGDSVIHIWAKEGTAKRWIEEIRKVVDGVRRASTHPSESDAPKRLSSSDTSGEEGSGTDLLEFETLTMNLVNQLNSLITEYKTSPKSAKTLVPYVKKSLDAVTASLLHTFNLDPSHYLTTSKIVNVENDEKDEDSEEFYDCMDASTFEDEVHEDSNKNTEDIRNNMLLRRSSFVLNPEVAIYNRILGMIPKGFEYRSSLPADKDEKNKASLIKILKDAIGKDLSAISIPVQWAEPLSLLQRLTEDFEYGELLNHAANASTSELRALYIAAFAVSSYSATYGRLSKPFNPILGETYEYINAEKGIALFTEQVSHHPPISAFYVQGARWKMWGHVNVRNKFWGKSIEIIPATTLSLQFDDGDHYTWGKVTTCIHNVIIGSKWIDHYGEMKIVQERGDYEVKLDFKKRGLFDKNAFEVQGALVNDRNELLYTVSGRWNEVMRACAPKQEEALTLWVKKPLTDVGERQYLFTEFSMSLNQMEDRWMQSLPPTDCRRRPDQRALEEGRVDDAADLKLKLEVKQRADRAKLKESGKPYQPVWFTKTEDDNWTYKGGYWEARLGDSPWPSMPSVFLDPQ